MSELASLAAIFVLCLLGLFLLAGSIVFLWLAYRYDISFSIRTKGKPKADQDAGA